MFLPAKLILILIVVRQFFGIIFLPATTDLPATHKLCPLCKRNLTFRIFLNRYKKIIQRDLHFILKKKFRVWSGVDLSNHKRRNCFDNERRRFAVVCMPLKKKRFEALG